MEIILTMMTNRRDHWKTRTALVTGASSGIGRAIARKLLDEGAWVVGLGQEDGEWQNALAGSGRELTVAFDLADIAAIPDRLASLPAEFSDIDTLVNCAGHDRGGRVRFDETNPAAVASVVGVNLTAMMVVTQALLPRMVQKGRGDVVNVGSIASRQLLSELVSYASSKHGVHGFSEALRTDLAKTKIRVMEVLPGAVRTGFAQARWTAGDERAAKYYEGRPVLDPDDIADVVLWMLDQPRHMMIAEAMVLPVHD